MLPAADEHRVPARSNMHPFACCATPHTTEPRPKPPLSRPYSPYTPSPIPATTEAPPQPPPTPWAPPAFRSWEFGQQADLAWTVDVAFSKSSPDAITALYLPRAQAAPDGGYTAEFDAAFLPACVPAPPPTRPAGRPPPAAS